MLTFNHSYDGGTFEESTISFECLAKMAKNALWAEKMYIELGMYEQAFRYGRIWARVINAMKNKISNV